MKNGIGGGVCLVAVHYATKHLSATEHALNEVKKFVRIDRSMLVANDSASWAALNAMHSPGASSNVVIGHDNSGMEFGAYQAGLDQILSECDPEWVLFANDTFATHHSFGSVLREKLVTDLARTFDHAACIGQVVSLPRSYQIEGARTHRWLTTNLFALNRAALRALDARVYRPALDALVTESSEMAAFFAGRLDPVLREHLEAWLFRAHPGWHWYASDPLQPANAVRMARKARSILQEKYLAALLEDASAAFVDLNELNVYKKVRREFERRMFELKKRRSD